MRGYGFPQTSAPLRTFFCTFTHFFAPLRTFLHLYALFCTFTHFFCTFTHFFCRNSQNSSKRLKVHNNLIFNILFALDLDLTQAKTLTQNPYLTIKLFIASNPLSFLFVIRDLLLLPCLLHNMFDNLYNPH